MIINIRGTSGSGKSTLIRNLMSRFAGKMSVFEKHPEEGKARPRKRPLMYVMRDSKLKSTVVIGHYESPCGGCDTIPKMERIFDLVRTAHVAGHHVLFEGLLISADIKRTLALHEDGLPLQVYALTTSLEDCLEGVNKRRRERLQEKYTPVNPKNTESKHRGVHSSTGRLLEAGVKVIHTSRETAWELIEAELAK